MPFVLEKISEEDKKKYGFGVSPNRWAIDRECDAFLIPAGGAGYGEAAFFELYLRGYTIKLITVEKGVPREREPGQSTKYDVSFDISNIQIPVELREDSPEVENILRDALNVWGRFGSQEFTGSVSVSYPSSSGITYINPKISNQR